uniref:Uncharacterized protein n=1 Tax=Avena sativa TaxID=4498 RepID=A0ACD5XB72_AVESA
MHRPIAIAKLALVLAAAAALSSGFFVVAHAHASCLPRERDALLAFNQGINDTYDALVSWQAEEGAPHHDCCLWAGVTCSNQTGHVTELDLGGTDLVGQISPSLLSLEHLEYLDLSWTSLHEPSGRVFPEFLCSLHNLRHLDLSDTFFSGRVPAQLANLSKLEYLDLSATLFSGTLPPQFGNLSDLRHLDLSFMKNIHTPTDISWLTDLHLLEYVDMSDINLSTADVLLVANTIPSLKALILINCSLPNADQTLTHLNLTKLEQLDLSRNYLGHPIETCWFWNTTSIQELGLDETNLYGPFPTELGGMTSLQRLYFRRNGNSATMTVDLKQLCDLGEIDLDESLAFGNITEFVMKLPQCSFSKLKHLSSTDNNMTGTLPDMMGHLNSLQVIVLSNNSITGAIPSGLRNFTSLEILELSLNQLSGQIPVLARSLISLSISMNYFSGHLPSDFGSPYLAKLDLSYNYLTGHVPGHICELKNLAVLDLSNNLFEGEFPWCSPSPSMEFLLLSNNNFAGNFPSWLQNCSSLVFLDLGVNKFYGRLPAWIGELVKLRFLQLNHNMFNGDIPVSILNLILLQHFSLASNNISGSVLSSLSKLRVMTLEHPLGVGSHWLYGDLDILSVVMKQQELKYGGYALDESGFLRYPVLHM